jgi:hypothetical protein
MDLSDVLFLTAYCKHISFVLYSFPFFIPKKPAGIYLALML